MVIRTKPALVTVVAEAAATSVCVMMFPLGVPETERAESVVACAENGIAKGNAPDAMLLDESTYTGWLAVAGAFALVLTGFPATSAFSTISARTESPDGVDIYVFN